MMTARTLNYRWTSSHYRIGRDDGIRVRISITSAVDMPEHVFAYRMLPVNPQTGDTAGVFSHVCSPVDLADYPAEAPIPGHAPEWFRLAFVDVLLRSTYEAVAFIDAVRSDLCRLKSTLDRTDTLMPGTDELLDADNCAASGISACPPSPPEPTPLPTVIDGGAADTIYASTIDGGGA